MNNGPLRRKVTGPRHLIHVVVGGQYGSEGKGAVTAHLARTATTTDVIGVRVGGPNAGHTVYDNQGRRWPLRQVPAAVVNPHARLAIAPGSVIDPQVLLAEVAGLEDAGIEVWNRLTVDPQATILTTNHRHQEDTLVERIGSTGKGIGAARAERLLRTATLADDHTWGEVPIRIKPWRLENQPRSTVIVEGTQGYALGLHAGRYPYATSADCRAIDVLADAGISPWAPSVEGALIWVVVRAHPIRVAGNSGPLPEETTWERLGLPEEQTTVTHKTRRVAMWDQAIVKEAILANGGPGSPVVLALMMYDHWFKDVAGLTELPLNRQWRLAHLEQSMGTAIGLVGTGPQTIVDRREAWVATSGGGGRGE